MNTIERLAELAKGATQGEWGSHDHGHRVAEIVVYAKDSCFAICCFEGSNYAFVKNDIAQHTADANYIAECNPAAIAQAATEYATLKAERDALREACATASDAVCGAKLCEIYSMGNRTEMLRLMTRAVDTLRAALAQGEEWK